jgi:hypothetical protein
MDDGPHFFTVEEANALRPRLELELGDLARLRSELAAAIEAVGGLDQAMAILQCGEPPPGGADVGPALLRQLAGEIARGVERIQALGCVLKDLDRGLVDFYALRDDEPIFLCWQLGEPAVAHWHPLDEGFAGRRRIEEVEIEPPKFVN